MRRRLLFAGCIVCTRHPALIAVLSLSIGERRLPWVEQLEEDFFCLWSNVRDARLLLPDPRIDPIAWANYMKVKPDVWKQLACKLTIFESCLDTVAADCSSQRLDILFARNARTNQLLCQVRLCFSTCASNMAIVMQMLASLMAPVFVRSAGLISTRASDVWHICRTHGARNAVMQF